MVSCLKKSKIEEARLPMFQSGHRFLASVSKDFVLHGLAGPDKMTLILSLLKRTGRYSKRASPIHPLLMVWLVVALALYRDCSIINVFEKLVAWAKEREPRLFRGTVTPEAVIHARKRLGVLPLKSLHREMMKTCARSDLGFHGLRVFGIDGSEFTIPDTNKNEAVFGRHKCGKGNPGYPHVRGLFSVEVATHRISNCCFLPCTSSEVAGLPFLMKDLDKGDLLLLDRGLASFPTMFTCQQREVRFLFRLSSNWVPQFVRKLGKGDTLMTFKASCAARKKLPVGAKNTTLTLRVLEFKVGKGELVRLVTDLIDPEKYPALELAELYHDRWECELAYKQLKSQLQAVTSSKQQTHFRSKSPDGVLQEAWGMVVAHTLVRELMLESSTVAEVPPRKLSFTDSIEVIKLSFQRFQRGGSRYRASLRRELIQELSSCLIARPRRKRQCPRVIKIKMSRFLCKREHHKEQPLDTDVEFVP